MRRVRFPQVKSFEGYDYSQVAFPGGYGPAGLESLAFPSRFGPIFPPQSRLRRHNVSILNMSAVHADSN